MTLDPGPHGRDTSVRRFLRSLRRWGGIIGIAAMAGLAPYAPPPPPPPVPRIEAREDVMDDDEP